MKKIEDPKTLIEELQKMKRFNNHKTGQYIPVEEKSKDKKKSEKGNKNN